MELYAKGQLSFLMLTCLKERDFYGLDIISEIANRSNGRINLKKPSVYSNLTRMEKQGYISSYMQSSDFGPNRKYYSLTESGRKFYQELNEYFDRNNIDVFRDFVDADSPVSAISQTAKEEEQTSTSKNDDFFDFSSIENVQKEEPSNDFKFLSKQSVEEEKSTEEIENVVETASLKDSDIQTTSIKNALAMSTQDNSSIEEYNKRLYDISKDINKFKRKRSFAEDQIAMQATAPLVDSQEKTKANIEEFKNSFLENKNKYQTEHFTTLDFSRYTKVNKHIVEEKPAKEELKNDAVFITKRYNAEDLEKPKRIEPPKLKITTSEPVIKDNKLPAPKRDKTIDPSHKEILTRLYSMTKDSSVEEVREDALYDFSDLKDYYNKQNIAFSEYQKSSHKVEHNTTKLYLLTSILTFVCAGILSGVLFAILASTGLLNIQTSFLYILMPALLLIDVAWRFYNFKRLKASMPSQILPQWQIWALYFIIAGIVVCLNFIFGLNANSFARFATTTILPLVIGFVILPLQYYLKRYLLIKHWK